MGIYVKRDENGEVIAVGRHPEPGMTEMVAADEDAVSQLLGLSDAEGPEAAVLALERSDAELVRVVEDLTNLMIDKGMIQFTELPMAAQRKLLNRRQLRRDRKALDLVSKRGDDGDDRFMP